VIQASQGDIRPLEINMGRFVDAMSIAEIMGTGKMSK
jgi:hypothetical protein